MKLEEFKEGNSVNLLFSSPETLEKHYEDLSNLSEIFLASLLMKRIAWLLGELPFFFQLDTNHE